eukprot:359059-Chlamydomonas_euryale.AAC.1
MVEHALVGMLRVVWTRRGMVEHALVGMLRVVWRRRGMLEHALVGMLRGVWGCVWRRKGTVEHATVGVWPCAESCEHGSAECQDAGTLELCRALWGAGHTHPATPRPCSSTRGKLAARPRRGWAPAVAMLAILGVPQDPHLPGGSVALLGAAAQLHALVGNSLDLRTTAFPCP